MVSTKSKEGISFPASESSPLIWKLIIKGLIVEYPTLKILICSILRYLMHFILKTLHYCRLSNENHV